MRRIALPVAATPLASRRSSTARMPALSKCIATISLGGSLPEKLQAAASVGFDGVKLCAHDLLTFPGGAHEVRDIADGVGLAIVCLRPIWEPSPATRTR